MTPTVSNFPTEKLPIVVEWFRGTESDTESSSFFFFKFSDAYVGGDYSSRISNIKTT